MYYIMKNIIVIILNNILNNLSCNHARLQARDSGTACTGAKTCLVWCYVLLQNGTSGSCILLAVAVAVASDCCLLYFLF